MIASAWSAAFTKAAVEDLRSLDKPVRDRARRKLEWAVSQPEPIGLQPLGGELRGLFKLRVGDWRVVVDRDDRRRRLVVLAIDHRRRIYRVALRRQGE